MVMGVCARAEPMRFETYLQGHDPDKANIRMGALLSDWAFSQSAGYRYTRSSGAGSDYLYENRYGRLRKDGSDFPLVSQLSTRNYLMFSEAVDLSVSLNLRYSYFPNGTEDNEFEIMPGLFAQSGAFRFEMSEDGWMGSYSGRRTSAFAGDRGAGMAANIGTDFELTPFLRGRVYDSPSYGVYYVDERGIADYTSGQKYPVFQNILGLDLDWLMAKDKSLGYSASRTDVIPIDEQGYDMNEGVVYRQTLDYQQQLNPVTLGGLRADWFWRDYKKDRGSQFQQDYISYLGADLTENTTARASLGYSLATLDSAGLYETNGSSSAVIGSLGLETRLTETLSHFGRYERSQRAGFQAGFELVDGLIYGIRWVKDLTTLTLSTAYEHVEPAQARITPYTDWLTQGSLSQQLTRRMRLTVSSAYTIRNNGSSDEDYLGEGNPYIDGDYDTWANSLVLSCLLTDHLTAYAYLDRVARSGDADALDATRDTVGVTLAYYNDF
jgi:hypothetical protein